MKCTELRLIGMKHWRKPLLIAAIALGSTSMALAGGIEVKSVSMESSNWEITVKLQDKDASPNVCDYYLQSFEYISALDGVVANLAKPDRCLTDAYGKRQGYFKWQLPIPVRLGGSIALVINGEKMGTIRISRSGVEFEGVPFPAPVPPAFSGNAGFGG